MDNTLTNERTHTSSKTRILAQIGMLGAISVVLMLFEIHCHLHRPFTRLTLVKYRYW